MIKSTDRKLVVGLEIGTAKVAALVGEVLPDGMPFAPSSATCRLHSLRRSLLRWLKRSSPRLHSTKS